MLSAEGEAAARGSGRVLGDDLTKVGPEGELAAARQAEDARLWKDRTVRTSRRARWLRSDLLRCTRQDDACDSGRGARYRELIDGDTDRAKEPKGENQGCLG